MDKGISQHWMYPEKYTQVDIGKSLERFSDMNQSVTESLLCDSMQNYETLL